MVTILHLITGLETGGAELMLCELATRTDRRQFRTAVVSMTDRGAIGPLIEAAGIAVYTLDMRRGLPDPRGVMRLARILRELQPAVLQTWLYHADLLGLLMRRLGRTRHLVWSLRCSDTNEEAVVRRILALGSASADAVVTVAQAGQRFHQQLGYHPRRWVYIPNGFDTRGLRPDEEVRQRGRGELAIAEGEVAILLPARWHPMKDHANFLAAAALLAPEEPRVRFFLAGGGVPSGLPAPVRSLGHRADLEQLYPAFDIVTLSSAFGEAFPRVLGEAMACGVPCVATDVGDSALVVGDAGIIVPPRDPRALAAGWRRLIALGDKGRRALGARARAHIAANYDVAQVVPRYEELYRELSG